MSDDLLFRLRDFPVGPRIGSIMDEAVDEIARLRAERDAAREEVARMAETVQDLVGTYAWYAQDREDRKPVMDGAIDDARATLALALAARAALQEGEAARATQAPSEGEKG